MKSNLERWKIGKPTIDGKRLIINIEIGGRTQFLTRAQGMPNNVTKQINKIINDFLWEGKRTPPINFETITKEIEGGKKILNIEIRNDAIELMKTKTYLSENRPVWAKIADILIKENAREKHIT